MSNHSSGRNRRDSPAEIPSELQLALGEIEYTDEGAAAFIIAVWQVASLDPDESPPPNPNWHQQSRRQNQEAARMDAQERAINRYDSDSSIEPHDAPRRRRYQLTRMELHLIHRALMGRRIDEGTRDILVQYFGDRFGSIPVRSRALEEAAEAPENPLTNTSLAKPEMEISFMRRPPNRRADTDQVRAHEQQLEFRARMQVAQAQITERNEQRQVESVATSRAIALRTHRDSSAHQLLVDELEFRAQDFAEIDPEAHEEWHQHRETTRLATDSLARQYQMLLWYRRGPEGSINDESRRVPSRLIRQIIRVERWHTRDARLEWRLHRAEMNEGSRTSMPMNDNNWAGMPSYEPVGYESSENGFGFDNYSPRHDSTTEAEPLLAHVFANFHARRIRLLHATSAAELAILLPRMQSFIVQALETFEHLQLEGETDPQLPADFLQRVADERYLLTTFQEEGIEYDAPSGDVGSPDEESDASGLEDEFPDGMPIAIENAREMLGDAGVGDDEDGEEERSSAEAMEGDDLYS